MKVPAPLYDRIVEAAERHNVDRHLVAAITYQECGFRLDEVVGDAGKAFGPMQGHLEGAAAGRSIHALLDHQQNICYLTGFLKEKLDLYPGDIPRAVTAYNWPAKAARDDYEPSAYAENVMAIYEQFVGEGLQRTPADAPETPSLLELLSTVWGCVEQLADENPKSQADRNFLSGIAKGQLTTLRQRLDLRD